MLPSDAKGSAAPIDMSLAGVFIGKGETIPDRLHDDWRMRLLELGLEHERAAESEDRARR